MSPPILEYSWKEAEWHARERARLAAVRKTPPFTECQIATIAHEDRVLLVTSSIRDFRWFEGLTSETFSLSSTSAFR